MWVRHRCGCAITTSIADRRWRPPSGGPDGKLPADDVPRLRREDVRGVRRTDGLTAFVERHEADASLHDQRVLPRSDHVSEAHAPDGVRPQPGLHPDLDVDAANVDGAA